VGILHKTSLGKENLKKAQKAPVKEILQVLGVKIQISRAIALGVACGN
jgi:hypothetical protein